MRAPCSLRAGAGSFLLCILGAVIGLRHVRYNSTNQPGTSWGGFVQDRTSESGILEISATREIIVSQPAIICTSLQK